MPIRPELKHYYRTKEWAEARRVVMRRAQRPVSPDEPANTIAHCERCGVRNRSTNARGSLIVLTVAHLRQDPRDHNPDHLAVLCQSCHLRHDKSKPQRARLRSVLAELAGQLDLFAEK